MSDITPWPVGTVVAWYGPYDRAATQTATVEKVYKTGHIVVRGRRFRLWSNDSAHETGGGYSRASVRPLTPAREAEIALSKKSRTAKSVATWLDRARPEDIPDDALKLLADAMLKPSTQ